MQIVELDQYTLQPNKMQAVFVEHVMEMWHRGIKRALLLSATGTGKTYASAFALREMNPRRVLFLVHREQIAKQTIKKLQESVCKFQNIRALIRFAKELDARVSVCYHADDVKRGDLYQI